MSLPRKSYRYQNLICLVVLAISTNPSEIDRVVLPREKFDALTKRLMMVAMGATNGFIEVRNSPARSFSTTVILIESSSNGQGTKRGQGARSIGVRHRCVTRDL